MRNTILFLLIGVFQMYAAGSYSQTTRLNLKLKSASVKEVLSEIENQSEFYFLYNSELIDVNRKVDISVKNRKINDVLKQLFADNDVKVLVNDKYIILTPVAGEQQNVITGKVTNDQGEPLPGVAVVIKGTTKGVITNSDGVYSLSDVPADATLVFSFIGMKTQEVAVNGQKNIDVTMQEDAYNLDEVITVGYSSVKKRDVTGSISSIGAKDLAETGSATLAQAIQGKTAGVLISRTNGRPGAGVSVRIRGMGGINNSEPLYIVDGIYGGSLSGINPDDIESIEILKDASSAAIYGARGANGVVLITTKRGKAGKMQVTYNGSIGFQNMINSGNVTMLNAQQYGEVQNTMYRNDGLPEPFGGDPNLPADLFPPPSQLGKGTDWLDVMFRSNAPIQDHLLSFSGGSKKSTYYISLSYLDQQGIFIESDFSRYNFRVNTDHQVKKWLKVGNNTSLGNSKQTGTGRTDEKYGEFWRLLMTEPTIPVFNEDGTLAGPPHNFYGPSRTPYARVTSQDPVNKSFGVSNLVYIELKPWEFLSFKTRFNNNYWAANNTNWMNNIYHEGIVAGNEVLVSGTNSTSNEWTWTNTLNFNKVFGKHNVHALAGYEMRHTYWNSINSSAKYLDPSYKVVNSGAAETSSINQSRGEESMVSYFGSVNYNFNEKYYLTANIRHDGSSRFGANNRFGTFPSFSVAWRISNEKFFPENDIVTDIKLRGSWGQVGNDKIGNYRYIAPMANVFYTFTGMYGDFNSGLVLKGLSNSDLKWETSTQTNLGIDLMMFKSKLRLTADYFVTDVTDMLLGKTIPVTSGIADLAWGRYVSVITNVGALTNKGFEFEIGYNDRIGSFTYGIHANLTTYNNEITDLGENEYLSGRVEGEERNRTYVGGSLADFYGYVCDGIFQTQAEIDAANAIDGDPSTPFQTDETIPGDFKYRDLNGDGVIDADDRQVIGSPIPDFTYGFGFDLGYRRFSFNALFYGSKGNEIYNALRGELEQQGRSMNKSVTVMNAWHGEGTSNTIVVRRVQDLNNNFRTSTAYLESGSFLRLQNIVLSYDIPVNFGKLNVFVSGDNLVTFTKYSGFNPEIAINRQGSNLDAGVDMGYYPSPSIYRIGVNITF